MSSVRVCAITCDCYPQDPLVRRTAEAAVKGGYEYHVICSMAEGQKKYEVFHGVHIHRLSLSRISGKPFMTMLWLWSVFAFLACGKVAYLHFKQRLDIVHIHNMPDFLVFAALVPKMFGARVILHVQDVSPELMAAKSRGYFRRIIVMLAIWQERISIAFADYVLTVGWPFEERLLKRGVPQKKLSSVLNSADPDIFLVEKRSEPFLGEPTAERPLVLMYHGTYAPRAGLDIAIRALVKAHTKGPYLRLHLKGSGGPYIPSLKQLAQELGATEYVVFLPGGPVDEVVDFVVQGDIGIIPYRADGFADLLLPTKAYEFALMRRPMIVSNTLAMRSMFRPESVMFCEPSNVDSLAEAIIDLYLHPEKRAQLVAHAEQDYMPYRWELVAKSYQQLLASLISENEEMRI
jgi:glycosyltransferase involved in cell wall biosynthesis